MAESVGFQFMTWDKVLFLYIYIYICIELLLTSSSFPVMECFQVALSVFCHIVFVWLSHLLSPKGAPDNVKTVAPFVLKRGRRVLLYPCRHVFIQHLFLLFVWLSLCSFLSVCCHVLIYKCFLIISGFYFILIIIGFYSIFIISDFKFMFDSDEFIFDFVS